VDADRAPVRAIKDSYPTYSAIAVDTNSNEVYLQDENLFGLKVFNRLDNTPPTAAFTEPKRQIGGINTKLEFNCGLYVDQRSGDVYSVNNDTVDTMVVFPRGAEGNAHPMREMETPHGTFGIAVDEGSQELYLTVEHDNAIVVYRKMAEGDETPLRLLQGDKTGLADPHGIVLDTKNGWMFVGNHGSTHRVEGEREKENWPLDRNQMIRGSGELRPPSITVYPLKASGDIAPLRVIQGPRTQLNWPSNMSIDEERGEIYVANDPDHSILIFKTTDQGDVAPSRIIKGPKTGIQNPTGVFADIKNDELWVSNMGNHSATVYSRTASGDAAPLRTIRSAPAGKHALMIGNPGAVEYDSKRDEILVPN
jgi:DNA-binding beta-propeller fold protein YncE